MKISCLPIFLLAILTSFRCLAQSNEKQLPLPEYMNQVYFFNASGNALQKLEEAKASHETKMMIYSKKQTGMDYTMDGAKSGMRVMQRDTAIFLIEMNAMMMDPTMLYTLYRCTSKGDKRTVTMESSSGTSKATGDNVVQLNVKKIKDDVYEFIPATKLEPGEYAFSSLMGMASGGGKSLQLFTFGVDGK